MTARTFSLNVTAPSVPSWMPSTALQWVAVPNSDISTAGVTPSPAQAGTNVSSVVNAWGSMAVRPTGSHLIVHGGGHSDYAGNEIYSLSLNTNSPAWVRKWGPTPAASVIANAAVNSDGNPTSVHAYHSLHYDSTSDALIRLYSSGVYNSGGELAASFFWYWSDTNGLYSATQGTSAGLWERLSSSPALSTTSGPAIARHPTTGDAYMFYSSFSIQKWTRSTRSWSAFSNNAAFPTGSAGAGTPLLDPATNCAYIFGGAFANGSDVYRLNLSTGAITRPTVTGTGAATHCAVSTDTNSGGADYDPVTGLFYLCRSGAVATFDPSTLVCTAVTVGGVAPGSQNKSLYGRFRFIPELNGFAMLPQWASPVYFFKVR